MVVIKEAIPALRKLYGDNFIRDVEEYSEIIGYSIEADDGELRVEFNPDRPDLFSFSLLRMSMDIFNSRKKWKPLLMGKSTDDFTIDKSVRAIRPYAVGFHCTGNRIGDHFRELIDYQEKLHLSIGRDRVKVSIGIHDKKNLRFPVLYSARKSNEVKFTTYDAIVTGTAEEILKAHPKGQEYAHLIPSDTMVPVIVDSDNKVLSLPPVVNGNASTVSEDTSSFFIDITGTDIRAVRDAFFLLLYYFKTLKYEITAANIKDIGDLLILDGRNVSVPHEEVEKILGQPIGSKDCVTLLGKMGYAAEERNGIINAKVPGNRIDVMGPVDIIEDIAKAYGYGNLALRMPNLEIIGAEAKGNQMTSNIRNIMAGLGYQEIMTFVVSKQDHYQNARYAGGLDIRNPKSLDFSVVRDRLYLGALDFLKLNKRRNLPQLVFEVGEIIMETVQLTHLCAARINSKSTFSDMKQVLDAILTRLSIEKYEINPANQDNFISGRTGSIVANGMEIGFLGEIHPLTLDQYELKNPVAILELNLTSVSTLFR